MPMEPWNGPSSGRAWDAATHPDLRRPHRATPPVISGPPAPAPPECLGPPAPSRRRAAREPTQPRPFTAFPPPGRPRVPRTINLRRRRAIRYGIGAVLSVLLVVALLTAHRIYDFGVAISTQPPLSTQTNNM